MYYNLQKRCVYNDTHTADMEGGGRHVEKKGFSGRRALREQCEVAMTKARHIHV